MFKTPVILNREHRLNPFYNIPAVSEEEFKKGMNYLVNKGIIHKDYDLTPAFENGNPTVLKKQCII